MNDFKSFTNDNISRLDGKIDNQITSLETRVNDAQENLAKNSVGELREQLANMQKMEESQNYVLKDCHEKT